MPNILSRVAPLLAVALSLVACEAPPPPDTGEVVRPVAMAEVEAMDSLAGLRFPGRVQAARRAELSFNVPGEIVELAVEEGDEVAAGDLLARLDATELEAKLAAARAELDQARVDFERVRTIWEETQAVARAEVDQKRTAYEVARSRYAAAAKDTEHTRLTAPFAGRVSRRYVEAFTSVQAKEPVVSLQDLGELEVVIHVPERIVSREPRRVAGVAELEGVPDRRLPVSLDSFAGEPDPQTQTYEVVLRLERPEGVTVLPGMAATVYPEEAGAGTESLRIPVAAVVARGEADTTVWVVDPETSQVAPRAVELGAIEGETVAVLDGLAAGERVVTAGIHHLHEGMRVRPLAP
jgi:RND family efflux transporter MFP subunit